MNMGRPLALLGVIIFFLDAFSQIISLIMKTKWNKISFIMNENYWSMKWSREQRKILLAEQFQAFWYRDLGVERQQLDEVLEN